MCVCVYNALMTFQKTHICTQTCSWKINLPYIFINIDRYVTSIKPFGSLKNMFRFCATNFDIFFKENVLHIYKGRYYFEKPNTHS